MSLNASSLDNVAAEAVTRVPAGRNAIPCNAAPCGRKCDTARLESLTSKRRTTPSEKPANSRCCGAGSMPAPTRKLIECSGDWYELAIACSSPRVWTTHSWRRSHANTLEGRRPPTEKSIPEQALQWNAAGSGDFIAAWSMSTLCQALTSFCFPAVVCL